MKFISPKVEYWPQEAGLEGVWKQITRATRTCYQSSIRDGETDEEFVKRVILKPALIEGDLNDLEHCKFDNLRLHGGCLEHGTIYLDIPEKVIMEYNRDRSVVQMNPMWQEILKSPYVKYSSKGRFYDKWYLTTNLRFVIENYLVYILEYLCEPTKYHTKRYTFNVITDIGVSREGNRTRKFSIAEESTRYNAYDKGKYNGEIKYALPSWVEKSSPMKAFEDLDKEQQLMIFKGWCEDISKDDIGNWDALSYYMFALKAAEFAYMGIRHNDHNTWTAEKARQVLNLNTKTQVVWTAFKEDWIHFLKLRSSEAVSGQPHPNIKTIADMIKQQMIDNKLI